MSTSIEKTPQRSIQVWLFLGICALPLWAAWVVYLDPTLVPRERVNRGELIEPPRSMPDIHLHTLEGRPFQFKDLVGRWAILWLIGSSCDEDCPWKLYQMRQIALVLNQERVYLERLVVPLDPRLNSQLGRHLKDYPGTWMITGPASEIAALADQIRAAGGLKPGEPGSFCVIDPQGNLILRYPYDADPRDMLKDLKRLLRYSLVEGRDPRT
jgi:cytochrome oxidase Cu insertion factor (SCO1/SenC/PrrC family)